MNRQREIIYEQRAKVLNGESLKENYVKMIDAVSSSIVKMYCSESQYAEEWDWRAIVSYTESIMLPKETLVISEEEKNSITSEELENKT